MREGITMESSPSPETILTSRLACKCSLLMDVLRYCFIVDFRLRSVTSECLCVLQPSTRLCLSMSDFHPETWNPLVGTSSLFILSLSRSDRLSVQWSVGTVLLGLYSFMLEETPTYGSIVTTDLLKRQFAAESLEYNVKNK